MKHEQRYHLHRLAEDLVTEERFGSKDGLVNDERVLSPDEQATEGYLLEDLQRALLESEWDSEIEAEKARLKVERAHFQPPYYGD